MSYLNAPRLTFSGQFQADPSTVNNDPTHYNNETFEPNFQDYQSADNLNGWWNPDGTGNWRLINCKITSVTYSDGTTTKDSAVDPIIGMSIMDTDSRTAAKIVDLDTQQQMVSQIWGLIVRIVTSDGVDLLRGDYKVAPFTNIWFTRSVDQSHDAAAGAIYQSVIKNLLWNKEFTGSRYLNELRSNCEDEISINFNVDRYVGTSTDPLFTLGRIAGSMAPTSKKSPKHFSLGRQLFPAKKDSSDLNYAFADVDEDLSQLVLDIGNSLQFSSVKKVNEKRDLFVAIKNPTSSESTYTPIGDINYRDPNWYMETSGIFTFPLTSEQLKLALENPLCIISKVSGPKNVFTNQITTTYATSPLFVECENYVRADNFVYRLNPEDICTIQFYASHLGKPLANAEIKVWDNTANTLGPGGNGQPILGTPPIAFFQAHPSGTCTIRTNENGLATLTFPVTDPGNPRSYIDGQVYGISYTLIDHSASLEDNPWNFISILIYDGKQNNNPPVTYENFIQPIMQQYANLYPLMSKGVFNLADKAIMDENAEILKLVFSKDIHDPNYMPATRDLSAYKTKVILHYLQTVIDNNS